MTLTDEQNRLINALNMSSGNDPKKQPLVYYPFFQGEWCIGTNGHHLLRVKRVLIPPLDISERTKPDVKGVIPTRLNLNEVVKKETLDMALKKVPKTKKSKCPDCHGDGIVKFLYESVDGEQYEKYETCPVCGGCGEITIEEPVMAPLFPCMIKDLYVAAKEIAWLSRIMGELRIKQVALRSLLAPDSQSCGDRAYFVFNENINMMFTGMITPDEDQLRHDFGKHKPVRVL